MNDRHKLNDQAEFLCPETNQNNTPTVRHTELVIGGSGSGKTRFFVKPNLLNQRNYYEKVLKNNQEENAE